ncbi:hypothetical protein KIW84_052024 [Lathyrus oleraceus]|uniref:Uncharacterized protein n=1 Tax=Pisum sativum TaxID=3888 RepID=A0A9D4WLK8_PEA|nr:hypothetical protein KIW84_052024 [Pisum sativum]
MNYNPYVDLPSLKVLHLESITFTRVAYLHKILSGTPILHELESADLRVEIPTMMPPLGIAISNLIRVMHVVNRMPPTIRGVFHNLTHLELIFNFHSDASAVFKWRWLRKMLQNTPNLQTLIIHELYKAVVGTEIVASLDDVADGESSAPSL